MRILIAAFFTIAALSAADATGHWSGTLSATGPNGEQREEPVLLILKQDGAKITGTGGRDVNDRHEVTVGKIDGDRLELEVEAGDRPVRLKLTLQGDELKGDVSRQRGDGSMMTAKISTKRVQDAK
jgi:hypothetical protein